MLGIYLSKFNVAGKGIRPETALYIGPLAYWTLKPAAWLMASAWLWLLSLITVGLAGAFLFCAPWRAHRLAAAFFGASGVMLLSEHAIILPANAERDVVHRGADRRMRQQRLYLRSEDPFSGVRSRKV